MKGQKITVIEYVHAADGRDVRVDELGEEQYETFRRWLGCSLINALYRGRAEAYYPGEATGNRQ